MISITLRLAKHTGVQPLEMPKTTKKTSQGESSSPWPDSLKDRAQGCYRWIQIRQAALGGGAGCVHHQEECKEGAPPQNPSPSSPLRVAELLHPNLSGLWPEGQRCASSSFGIMPRRIRCPHQFPVVHKLVIKCTNKIAGRAVPTLG